MKIFALVLLLSNSGLAQKVTVEFDQGADFLAITPLRWQEDK